MSRVFPTCVKVIPDRSLSTAYSNGLDLKIRTCAFIQINQVGDRWNSLVRNFELVSDFTFPTMYPISRFPMCSTQTRPKRINPSTSTDVLPVCTCNDCTNQPLFPSLSHAYESIDIEKREGIVFIKFRFNEFVDLDFPYANVEGYSLVFVESNQSIDINKYKSFGSFLNRIETYRRGLRSLRIAVRWRTGADRSVENVFNIKLKRDHANNLIMCIFKHYTKPMFVISVRDMKLAIAAMNSTSTHVNRDHCYRFLKGPSLLPGIDPGCPLIRRHREFPFAKPLIEFNDRSKHVRPILMINIPLPDALHDIILDYVDTYDPVVGPLEDSPLRVFFNSPIYEPRLFDMIGLFIHCPTNACPLADAYTNGLDPPNLL
jgi:hypothetical protein